jgi:CRP/FNR family transcriptional regulator, anaerobic regulatory protein
MQASSMRETLIPELRRAFPELSDSNLVEELVREGRCMRFRAGDIIIDFGEYIRMVPLVLEGSIKVLRENEEGDELFLYFLNSGESCSMSFSCCMADKRSSIRAIAEEDTRILGIPVRYVDEWISRYPVWKNFVLRSYDQRLVELINTIDTIAFKKLDERLLDYLEQKSDTHKTREINVTHQQIAMDLHASREAISRLLKQLEKVGRVELGRNKVTLL